MIESTYFVLLKAREISLHTLQYKYLKLDNMFSVYSIPHTSLHKFMQYIHIVLRHFHFHYCISSYHYHSHVY